MRDGYDFIAHGETVLAKNSCPPRSIVRINASERRATTKAGAQIGYDSHAGGFPESSGSMGGADPAEGDGPLTPRDLKKLLLTPASRPNQR